MQEAQINTARDEKMVEMDTSGDDVEIILDSKENNVIQSDPYEAVKTNEVEPLSPRVEEEPAQQKEELEDYSTGVKKRIDKLTFKLREAERERQAALDYATNVQRELSDSKRKYIDVDKGYMSESEVRNKMASDLARQNLIQARENGDFNKEEEARQSLTKLDLESERIRVTKTKKEREYDETSRELDAQQAQYQAAMQQQQQQPRPSQKAISWAERNSWFNSDPDKTDLAKRVHRGLVAEGFDTESDEYYDELTKRVSDKFPSAIAEDQATRRGNYVQPVSSATRSATTGRNKSVRLSPSQVKIAKKLGVPLTEYAKYV
tara:strand:+ start:1418 stop:2377 length:960 start_codon:yes stop_codon:yes gene_type:complete